MHELRSSPLAPIRFYPTHDFEQGTRFQNPDNRVSTGYDWEGVYSYPYHLAIPKQWPDGEPGIDTMVILDTTKLSSFDAKLYDADNVYVKTLNADLWQTVGTDEHYRIWLNCRTTTEVTDGIYTIKLMDGVDVLLESEAMLIGEWFEGFYPFKYSNFENDFGLIFDNGTQQWTGRMMLPLRMYDPEPTFEKKTFQNDPGVLTTLRVTPQRVFRFDISPVPVHVSEAFQLACSCSNLYLDQIKINFEDIPESDSIEGTNLKEVTGQATFVDFNENFSTEQVEVEFTDEEMDWDSQDWGGLGVITNNSLELNNAPGGGALLSAEFDQYIATEGEQVFLVIELTDDGSSDMPIMRMVSDDLDLVWGINYISYTFATSGGKTLRLRGVALDTLNLTCTVDWYSID